MMTQNKYQGSDVLEHLDFILPETDENHLLERQELFRIDLTQAMRQLRKEIGLTQKDVAEKLGVTQSWVSKLESANNDHTFESVLAYLDALEADFEAVIYLENNKCIRVRSESQLTEDNNERQIIDSSNSDKLPQFEPTLISSEQQKKYKEANKYIARQGFWGTAA
jgi:transcriptional regulator with XRE-family HTH domain